MRLRTTFRALFATTVLAAAAIAAPASAAVTVTLSSFGDPLGLAAGEQLIADFNNPGDAAAVLLPGYALTLNGATVGVDEGGSGYSGTLANDATTYLTVPGGASATLTSEKGLKTFSLYMGSPDTYNSVQFLGLNGFNVTLTGGELSGGNTSQAWDWGMRVNFDFGADTVTQVVLRSTSNSFEVDNFAVGAVPEPATWAMMISGFGMAGAAIRRRRTAVALA